MPAREPGRTRPTHTPTHTPTQPRPSSPYTNPCTNSAQPFALVEQREQKEPGFYINPYIRRYISLYPYYMPYLPILLYLCSFCSLCSIDAENPCAPMVCGWNRGGTRGAKSGTKGTRLLFHPGTEREQGTRNGNRPGLFLALVPVPCSTLRPCFMRPQWGASILIRWQGYDISFAH